MNTFYTPSLYCSFFATKPEWFFQVNTTHLDALVAQQAEVKSVGSWGREKIHTNKILSVMFLCSFKLRVWFVFVCCRFLGVPPGRGSCPLTGPLPFDLIYTDYHGLQQMKQHMGLSLKKHKLVVHVHCVYVWSYVFSLCMLLYLLLCVCVVLCFCRCLCVSAISQPGM